MATTPYIPEIDDDISPSPGEDYLKEDLRKAVLNLTPQELQFLVSRFYQIQEDRKRAYNQLRASSISGAPNAALVWTAQTVLKSEREIATWLALYTEDKRPGRWLRSIHGIGPVLAAGLLAYLDITRAPHASSFWSYAGLSGHIKWLGKKGAQALYTQVRDEFPARTPAALLLPRLAERSGFAAATLERWARGYDTGAKLTQVGLRRALLDQPQMTDARVEQLLAAAPRGLRAAIAHCAPAVAMEPDALLVLVRGYDPGGTLQAAHLMKALARCPWNRSLKLHMYKVGEYGIVRPSTSAKASLYSRTYREQKAGLVAKNAAGGFADLARRTLETRTFEDVDVKAVYASGHLPDGRVDRFARAYAAKLLLAHLHHVLWECHYGTPPPLPYAFAKEPGRHQHYIPPPLWPCD